MVPNDGGRQWGARYFLPLIPIVIVGLCLADKKWDLFKMWKKPVWLTTCIFLCLLYSFYHNTWRGGLNDLRWSYSQRIKPAYDSLGSKPGNVVVIFAPYQAYEMGYLFNKAYFFLAPGDDSLRKLLPLLKQQGIHEYTYVSDPRIPRSRPASLRDPATMKELETAAKENKIRDQFLLTKFTIE